MKEFVYAEPTTVAEAVRSLSEYGDGAKALAGGTDLLKRMLRREVQPQCLVSLARIDSLKDLVCHASNGLRIGAGVTIRTMESNEDVATHYPMLRAVAEGFGTAQVRSVGTVAGNLCNASPAAEFAPPLLALGAGVTIFGPRGERQVALEAFFTGPGTTILEAGELVRQFVVPPPRQGGTTAWCRHRTREMLDVSIVSVAVWLHVDKGVCQDVRIALGAAAPTPIRAYQAEKVLIGKRGDEECIAQVGQAAMMESNPLSDFRASADYRRALVAVCTRRALRTALDSAIA
jgi:carbon-monoxide dehydrogenase medium subunit